MNDYRVARTYGALHSPPRKSRKRRRCDGHINPVKHFINVGDLIVWVALPPDDPEIGNKRWWHMAFCADCAPL